MFNKTNLALIIRDWDKYSTLFLNTNLENNFRQLLEILKECLDSEPENRPNCYELLQRINELIFDKTVLTEDKNIIDFKTVLEKQEPKFLLKFFNYKLEQNDSYL